MLWWLIGIILGKIICESSNWQHIQRLKITILGANCQLFRLERIAKCSYFMLSTQNIKFYWFVMKIKKFMLPIWWYNRGLFPLGNEYFGVFILNGLRKNNAIKESSNVKEKKKSLDITNNLREQALLIVSYNVAVSVKDCMPRSMVTNPAPQVCEPQFYSPICISIYNLQAVRISTQLPYISPSKAIFG